MMLAIQSFLNTGFRSAVQAELWFMIGGLYPVTKAARSSEFDEEIHALYEALLACGGRLGP